MFQPSLVAQKLNAPRLALQANARRPNAKRKSPAWTNLDSKVLSTGHDHSTAAAAVNPEICIFKNRVSLAASQASQPAIVMITIILMMSSFWKMKIVF